MQGYSLLMKKFIKFLSNVFNLKPVKSAESAPLDDSSKVSSKSLRADLDIIFDDIETDVNYVDLEAVRQRLKELQRTISEGSEDVSSSELQKLRRSLRKKKLHYPAIFSIGSSATPLTDILMYSSVFHLDPIAFEISLTIKEINKALKRRRLPKKESIQNFLFSNFVKSRVLIFSFARPKGVKYSPVIQKVLSNELFWKLHKSEKKNEKTRFNPSFNERRLCPS